MAHLHFSSRLSVCAVLLQVADFTDKVNSYVMNAVMFFKSMWPEVKCNASLFVGRSSMHNVICLATLYYSSCNHSGFMLGNLPKEKAGLISKEHICEGIRDYIVHTVTSVCRGYKPLSSYCFIFSTQH